MAYENLAVVVAVSCDSDNTGETTILNDRFMNKQAEIEARSVKILDIDLEQGYLAD